ncbi:hypothetical protein [Hydrogenophaga sp.]|uniref:hypothetical protein n=1 Tax=Hydrogenophaga sp. TaxID=1904254 RepID=UPI0027302942|nr:hypothetical protein [Hydrogenophaga sp.]MDP2072661.1 hypothetical protein [Hydrogenophaga sp.]MDP3108469.1 hypothetical protein [Hydrogenophaga sp.]MDP3348482.1 hypothetical protein [Hydrogenophaga sp.]MDZ4280560.1 hypothetical protein [Hydrogenophaga sp.]MDZ4397083.1 hypothetical protein [Hydrogenophaga sp.]
MTPLSVLAHLAGFVAPALGVGLLLWAGLRIRRKGRPGLGSAMQLSLLWVLGIGVLLAGLIYFGRDGKIATYAALVLIQGTVAWWLRGR